MREELTSASFTIDDARVLMERLRDLYGCRVDAGEDLRLELREVIRPAYRHMLELLSGREPHLDAAEAAAPLVMAPVLAQGADGRLAFRPAGETYYLDRRDTRERLGASTALWAFVLDALPLARAPLVQFLGMRVLEDWLHWTPQPGDPAIAAEGVMVFRMALRELAPFLLARVAAERSDERTARHDARRLRLLVHALEPVRELHLSCELDGHTLGLEAIARDAFVQYPDSVSCRAFVVWGEHPWPSDPHEAEALATVLGDALGAGYFESFLALIAASSPTARLRILRRAGAPTDVDERRVLLQGADDSAEEIPSALGTPPKTAVEPTSAPTDIPADSPPQEDEVAGAPRTRLLRAEMIVLDGVPVLLVGRSDNATMPHRPLEPSNRGPARQAASTGYGGHTDLDLLDALGLLILLQYERNRLRRDGHAAAAVFDATRAELQPDALVFDVSRPSAIVRACEGSPRFARALGRLHREHDVSREWPGFDVLSLDPGRPDELGRLIELKSSGVASRVQEMSWNEWKTARSSRLRDRFYLGLVGNLRADLGGAKPFVRMVRNPFEQLASTVQVERRAERVVHLAVDRFREAEHLDLEVVHPADEAGAQKGSPVT